MNIPTLLSQLTQQLQQPHANARLEAELLICHCLNLSRAQLYTRSDEIISAQQLSQLELLVQRRINGEPLAYILGHQEFWSLELEVNPATLIPRPETEHLVEWALANLPAHEKLTIADLGTGSGAIAIALAHERPLWTIHATDLSLAALATAKRNATRYHLSNVSFYHGNWCAALPQRDYAAIISNPPYITDSDPHLAGLHHEPISALTSGQEGLDDITKIATQAQHYLIPNGVLLIEHGYHQQDQIVLILQKLLYTKIQRYQDLAGQPRYIAARIL